MASAKQNAGVGVFLAVFIAQQHSKCPAFLLATHQFLFSQGGMVPVELDMKNVHCMPKGQLPGWLEMLSSLLQQQLTILEHIHE